MGVEVSSNAYPRMSQPLTDHLEMHSSSQHQTGVGMTQVMEPHTIQTRFLCSVPKRLCHSIWMYRSLSHRPVGELTNTGVGAMDLKRGRPVQFHRPLVGP